MTLQSSFDTTRGSGHRPRVTGVHSGGDGTLLHGGDFEGAYKVHILLWGRLGHKEGHCRDKTYTRGKLVPTRAYRPRSLRIDDHRHRPA